MSRFERPSETDQRDGDSITKALHDARSALDRAERLTQHLAKPPPAKVFPPGIPDCPRCQGRGEFRGGAGFDVRCPCTEGEEVAG